MFCTMQFCHFRHKLLHKKVPFASNGVRGLSRRTIPKLKSHLKKFLDEGFSSAEFNNIQFESTNGSRPCTFENAENKLIYNYVTCDFSDIFSHGFETVYKFCGAGMDLLDGKEQIAIGQLLQYFEDLEFHQRKIQDMLYTHHCFDIPKKKEEITLCYVEHLLKRLVPPCRYTLSSTLRTQDGLCSCGTPGNYGHTGIGNPAVWHGHPDIIIEGHKWGNTVLSLHVPKTLLQPTSPKFTLHNTVWEVLNDEELIPIDPMSEEEMVREVNLCLSQTITFSFLQRYLFTGRSHFMNPGISMSCTHFDVFLYDCLRDVLLTSSNSPSLLQISFDENNRPVISNLNTMAVIYLWFILNHGQFCSGISDMIAPGLEKSGFHRLLRRRIFLYKHYLAGKVDKFPQIPKAHRGGASLDVENEVKSENSPKNPNTE